MPKDANKKQDVKKQDVKKQESKKQDKKNKRHFMKDFKAELKRVIWPTPKQLLNNTVAVITVVLITAAIVFVLDFAFESLNTYGVDRLKEMVENQNSESSNTVVNNEVEEDTNTTEENSTNETDTNATDENVSSDEDSNSVE